MKTKNFFLGLTILLLVCCKKEEEILPIFSRPVDFHASKGEHVEKIRLSWLASPEAQNYQIFKFDSLKTEYVLLGETSQTYFEDTIRSLANTKYYYKLRIYNSKSKFSDFSDFDYGFTATFITPSYIEATNGTSDVFVKVSWNQVIGATQYQVFRASSESGNYTLLDTTSNAYYNDITVASVEDYFYKVKAYNPTLGFTEHSKVAKGYKLEAYIQQLRFGTPGASEGQLSFPNDLVIDDQDHIYISESSGNRVQKFTTNGNYISTLTFGGVPAGMSYINGNIIVAKPDASRVQIIDYQGTILEQWGNNEAGDGYLKYPVDVAVDQYNNFYVSDPGTKTIKKYNAKKEFISSWGNFDNSVGLLIYDDHLWIADNKGVYEYSLEGQHIRTILDGVKVNFITTDNNKNIYLAAGNSIIKMNTDFKVVARIGQLNYAMGVCVDSDNKVYVTDTYNHQVLVFNKK